MSLEEVRDMGVTWGPKVRRAIRRSALLGLVAGCAALGLPSTASASCTKTWTGGFSANWEDWQNWAQCDPIPNNQEAPDGDDDVVIDGAAVTLSSGTTINSLSIGGTSASSLLYNSTNNNPFMQAGNGITIGSHATVTLDGTTGLNHGAATLDARSSTLTNNGTITTQGGASFGAPSLAGNVTNNSTINVNANTNYNESTATTNILDNKGSVNIANGVTLTASGQSCGDTGDQVTNDSGGSINATGTGSLVAVDYTQGAGTTSGTTPVIQSCGFLHYTGSGASSVLANAGNTLIGALSSGQSLTIRADNFNTSSNATAGFANNGGSITLDCLNTGCAGGPGGAPVINVGANTLTNTGTITITPAASGGGGFTGNVTQAGILQFNGSGVATGGTFTQTGGTTTVTGGTTFSVTSATGGVLNVSGGMLNGSGTIAGSVSNTGGQVQPGSSPGTLTVTGNYAQGSGGTLDIPVNGISSGQFSVLSVNGNTTLGGTLALQLSTAYAASAAPSDTVTGFLRYGGTRTGPFATTTVNPPLSDGKTITPNYVDASKRVDVVVGNPAAPANTGLPAISGTTTQGQTLSSTNGSWDNHPTSFGYQWLDCDGGGNNCTNVGTNANTYTLTNGDAGHTVRVIVTATNAGGPSAATSAQTATVVPLPPANTALPTISGETTPGQTLSTSDGSWNNNPTSFAYQWRACDGGGNNCTNVGTNANTYTLTNGDAGHTVRVIVTATNAGGSTVATSGQTAVVAVTTTPPPTLSGVGLSSNSLLAKKGTTLSLTLSTPASIKAVIAQRVSGRKVNGRCKPGARKGKPCKVTRNRRTLTVSGIAGVNHFQLRTNGLAPGRYMLTVTATDAAGRTSNQVTLSFKIKKPKK